MTWCGVTLLTRNFLHYIRSENVNFELNIFSVLHVGHRGRGINQTEVPAAFVGQSDAFFFAQRLPKGNLIRSLSSVFLCS